MPVEIKGQQLRIRMKEPSQFSKFRTQDVGKRGRLQRLAGYKNGKWETQSWRLNLDDYKTANEAIKQIRRLKIPSTKKSEAINLIRRYKE